MRGLDAGAPDRALERTGLAPVADRAASTLSGGLTQRLSLAQALLGEPELLVMDEPTASLDPRATWEFRGLMGRLRAEGVTVLLCSHRLAEVERVADRVLILNDGRAAAVESLATLRARQIEETRLDVELDEAPRRAIAALERRGIPAGATGERGLRVEARGREAEALEALRAAGVGVRAFEQHRPSLEDLFLDVVAGGVS